METEGRELYGNMPAAETGRPASEAGRPVSAAGMPAAGIAAPEVGAAISADEIQQVPAVGSGLASEKSLTLSANEKPYLLEGEHRNMRESGILCHISSLPSPYGIGALSKEAFEFVDFLKKAGQSFWQILPLGPTGYGDSPYQSFSTFAGNPYFIDLVKLIDDGLLTKEECDALDFGSNPEAVDFGRQYESRFKALRIACERFRGHIPDDYYIFTQKNSFWLEDYALFMALKDENGGKCWHEWDTDLRDRRPDALAAASARLTKEIGFWRFQQYEFDRQWKALLAYAHKNGVSFIGDIPIYLASDSADAWANPRLLQFNAENESIAVAGCPPDGFSADGQLWGNPLYDWEYLRENGYDWWIRRIAHCLERFDVLRVDHFRAFDEYYAIPFGSENAKDGRWEKGPGIEFFEAVKRELGKVSIIAEDLGYLTDSVRKLVRDTGFPGMKVLQFAFDSSEDSDYLPFYFTRNAVVYTGTHDNETTLGWVGNLNDHDRDFARRYIHSINTSYGEFVWDLIREAQRSVCDLCIIPMQDYLVKGNEARMNRPATMGSNWQWRMKPHELSDALSASILEMTKLYGRLVKHPAITEEI